jgi:putative pyruvate formate lyase activating enzyme
VVSSAFAHFGEEDCLRGWHGSGTIFFAHCNLRCVFCQNHDISQGVRPGPAAPGLPAARLATIMLALQEQGCHNINFVTPEHVVPQVLEAVAAAAALGLRLPLVYNTSAYDSLDSLALLDGVIDIYMPDLKYWSAASSHRYLKAEDYPDVARAAIREMHRQVGELVLDERGIAQRGILLRHLVMPGGLDETRAILEWVASTLGPGTYVNLMDQYRPAGVVSRARYPELARRLSPAEYRDAVATARDLGLRLDARRAG